MHCDSPEPPTLDEFVDDIQTDLYLNGLKMAAMLSAQLQAELADGPNEDSLKKWYMWTRGLNQLQTFRYAPARQATREQKQRGRPPQEPKVHLNGPAPQLRKSATPKAQTQPGPESMNHSAARPGAYDPSDPYVSSDPSAQNRPCASPASSDTQTITNTSKAPKSQKVEKSCNSGATPTKPTKFDQINRAAENGSHSTLTPTKPTKFDQINAKPGWSSGFSLPDDGKLQ